MNNNYLKINIRFLAVLWVLFPLTLFAMPDTNHTAKPDSVRYWKFSGNTGLTFNQLSLTNWASGGESSASGKVNANTKLVYNKNRFQFESISKLAYGIVGYGGKRIEKTEDRIDLATSATINSDKNWAFSSVLSLKTQFANGYKYPNDSTLISTFFAPGVVNASIGYRYKKSDVFELFLSPASGKFTFVLNQELANKGAFGVKPAVKDTNGMVLVPGSNLFGEFGFNLLANFAKEVSKNIELSSTLNLYNNYLDDNFSNRWNIDVDWETTINFTINKRVQTVLFMQLKYDHNVKLPVFEVVDGEKVQIGEAPKLQFKESLGIGITYNLG
ncbi:MAG: DUF3078 domain-containing protein [Bacteroidales bacterium]|nr:DUF3078 domain-containing protein [Bacteroidales bacterium]HOI33444.1 DUF3078 domain-containing protein [Bacteroidales bacterium]